MLDRPLLLICAALTLMLAPMIAAPQLAFLTGVPLVGMMAALMLMTLPILTALIGVAGSKLANLVQIFLFVPGIAMMLHWRPGQSVAEVLDLAKWTALPLALTAAGLWGLTQIGGGWRRGTGFGRHSFVTTVSMVLVLAFLTFTPIAERGYGLSLTFAVLAVGAHCALLLQVSSEPERSLSRAQVWAVRLVEAIGFADLLVLIAVLRPETPLLFLAIATPVASLVFLIHAPINKAFRRQAGG